MESHHDLQSRKELEIKNAKQSEPRKSHHDVEVRGSSKQPEPRKSHHDVGIKGGSKQREPRISHHDVEIKGGRKHSEPRTSILDVDMKGGRKHSEPRISHHDVEVKGSNKQSVPRISHHDADIKEARRHSEPRISYHDVEVRSGHRRSATGSGHRGLPDKQSYKQLNIKTGHNDSKEKIYKDLEVKKTNKKTDEKNNHKKLNVKEVHKESKNVRHFKAHFKNLMMQFRERVESRANESGYSGSWRDALAGTGFSLASAGATTGATVLGIAGATTAAATAGVSLGVAAAGIGALAGYNIYRTIKKKRQYRRALGFLQCDDLEKKVSKIADKLADIYRCQLSACSPKAAKRLANACYKSLKHEMLSNRYLVMGDFMKPANLQAFIVKSAAHIKKQSFSINGSDKEKTNTRNVVKHATLYCHENQTHYSCKKSQPFKSGVLFFKTQRELDLCKLQIEKIKKDKWHYEEMSVSQVKHLERNFIFNSNTIVTARVPDSAKKSAISSQAESSEKERAVVTSSSDKNESSSKQSATTTSSSSRCESSEKERAVVSSSSNKTDNSGKESATVTNSSHSDDSSEKERATISSSMRSS